MLTRTYALCWLGIQVLAAGAATAGEPRVALLPIVVHSAEADTGYLSQGLAEMLSARLERSPGLEVVRIDNASGATTRRDLAVEAAREVQADFVVYGSFTQFGSGASLDVHCAPANEAEGSESEPREVFIQSGTVGEIIPKLDGLADKVARFVVAGPATAAAPVAKTGASPAPAAAGGPGEIEDLRRRVEALERIVEPDRPVPDLVPGNAATIGQSADGPASAEPSAIPLR